MIQRAYEENDRFRERALRAITFTADKVSDAYFNLLRRHGGVESNVRSLLGLLSESFQRFLDSASSTLEVMISNQQRMSLEAIGGVKQAALLNVFAMAHAGVPAYIDQRDMIEANPFVAFPGGSVHTDSLSPQTFRRPDEQDFRSITVETNSEKAGLRATRAQLKKLIRQSPYFRLLDLVNRAIHVPGQDYMTMYPQSGHVTQEPEVSVLALREFEKPNWILYVADWHLDDDNANGHLENERRVPLPIESRHDLAAYEWVTKPGGAFEKRKLEILGAGSNRYVKLHFGPGTAHAQKIISLEPPSRSEVRQLEETDELLRYRAAKSDIARGYAFQFPNWQNAAQVFWASPETEWQREAIPMERLESGLWAVVIPENKIGLGEHTFKFIVRFTDGHEEWQTGEYATREAAGITNAFVKITEDSTLFKPEFAKRILQSRIELPPSPIARLVSDIPISALRAQDQAKEPGIGKFTDLEDGVLEEEGAAIFHLLPHHAIDLWGQSPYGTLDYFSVNELNIHWARVEEIKSHPESSALLNSLIAHPTKRSRIDYDDVRTREEPVKWAAYRELLRIKGERYKQYQQFIHQWDSVWLNDYAEFISLLEIIGKPLPAWKKGDEAKARSNPEFQERVAMHKYTQWIGTEQQLRPAFQNIEGRGGMIMIDHPMFAAVNSVYAWKHPEYFKPGYPGIIRKNKNPDGTDADSYDVNEQWKDLLLWNWTRLRELDYEPILAPIRYWLKFGNPKLGTRLIRLDALHLAWNNGRGQLASGDEDGDHYVARVTREIRKYGGVAASEAYEGRQPEIESYGVIAIPSTQWRRISDHDNSHPSTPRFSLSADALRDRWNEGFLNSQFREGNLVFTGEPMLVAVSGGHFEGPVYPYGAIKRLERGDNGDWISYWDWRYPLPSDEDYLDRVRFDLRPYVRARIRAAKAAREGKVWEAMDSLTALLVDEANRFRRQRTSFRAFKGLYLSLGDWEEAKESLRNFQRGMEKIFVLIDERRALRERHKELVQVQGEGRNETATAEINEKLKSKEGELGAAGMQLYSGAEQMWFIRVLEKYVNYTQDWDFARQMLPVIRRILGNAMKAKEEALAVQDFGGRPYQI
ncbi:MAG: 4-alpha-glucanotransferase, partial [Candidatus Omnitrophica bacterium]|nr:4-alpha-glucanotransferase [Candidatus Omnitrophota bacterium]